MLFSWDEYDRLRKVPKNVSDYLGNNSFEQYIGCPYSDIPDPFGKDESYAAHFEKEFMESLKKFGIEMEYRYQAKEYRSGRYAEYVIFALKNRGKIYDILDRHRTQEGSEEEREQYYPVSIFCPHCHKDFTKITSLSEDCTKAHYVCECGHEGDFDFTKDFNCKLQWKVDWPMRWMVEGVDFEPGGKDHASKNGSYDTAKDISREVFGGLDVTGYVLAKFTVLASVGLVQCLIIAAGALVFIDFPFVSPVGGALALFLSIYLVNLSVTAMGLLISAVLKNAGSAILPVLVVIVMQVVFSDCVIPIDGAARVLCYITSTMWGVALLGRACDLNSYYPVQGQTYNEIYSYEPILCVCVLAAIKNRDSYGYQIVKDIKPCVEISESTLYPILRRLENAELLTVRSVEHSGRLRKYYHITPAGLERIRVFQEEWKEILSIYQFITREDDSHE